MGNSSLLHIQAGQHGGQTHVALFKIGYCSHNLLVSHVAAGLFQLNCQICQFLGVGGVVTDHILHQCQQFFQGRMLMGSATLTTMAALVIVVMMIALMIVMMTALMGVGVCVALAVQMVVGVGMLVVMLMAMCMGMGMGDTVMGVLMGVGMLVVVAMTTDMIVVDMHRKSSLHFFFIISILNRYVKTFIFAPQSPPTGLRKKGE